MKDQDSAPASIIIRSLRSALSTAPRLWIVTIATCLRIPIYAILVNQIARSSFAAHEGALIAILMWSSHSLATLFGVLLPRRRQSSDSPILIGFLAWMAGCWLFLLSPTLASIALISVLDCWLMYRLFRYVRNYGKSGLSIVISFLFFEFLWITLFLIPAPVVRSIRAYYNLLLGVLTVVDLGLLAMSAITNPILEFIWVYLHLRSLGLIVKVYYSKSRVCEYTLDRTLDSATTIIKQSQVEISFSGKLVYGCGLSFSNNMSASVEALSGLNTAACELYERYATLIEPAAGRNLNSNGVAVHLDRDEAISRSRFELLERDSVLAHYYTERPALAKYDLRGLQNESVLIPELQALTSLADTMDSAALYRLYCPLESFGAYWVVLKHRGKVAYGWCVNTDGKQRTVVKAFSEAISVYRFYQMEKNATLLKQFWARELPAVTHDNFLTTAKTLGISNTDLQVLLVLGSDPVGMRVSFLDQCDDVKCLDTILNLRSELEWYDSPVVDSKVIPQQFTSPFTLVRSTSQAVFQVDWPRVSEGEIRRTAAAKGISTYELRSNILAPCVIY